MSHMNILFVRVILLIYCIYAPASLAKTRHLNVESEHVSIQNLPGQAHDHHYKLGSTDMEEIEQKFDAKLIGRFQLDLLQVNKLADVLDDPSNQDYRFFFIRFLKEKGFKYLEVFDFLDRVLTPRVWMSLRFFVTEKKTGLQKHFVIPEDTLLEYIIIEHLPKTADIAARIIAKQNYPSASECEKRPMITTNIIGDAWGNRMRNTMGVLQNSKKYVTYLAATKSAQTTDVTPFNAPGECPDKINKHECMFMSTTNCTIPDDLLPALAQRKADTMLFSKAAADGKRLDDKRFSEYANDEFRDLPEFKVDDYSETNTYEMIQLNRSYTYINTGHVLTVEKGPLLEFHHESDPFGGRKRYYSYAMRLRAEFQFRVQYLVDTFRATNHFYSNQTCVMHHMRKDDRQEKGADMIEWCKQRSYYDAVRKHLVTSGSGLNYGCQLVLPYGAASLEHYFNASAILFPTIKNIFIATDDQAWLHQALEEYAGREDNVVKSQQLRLLPFHPRHGHRQSSSLDVNAEFFATIELGRQCEGFVGYLQASAAADLFFGALCYRHQHHYLKCPNAFDFGSTAFP